MDLWVQWTAFAVLSLIFMFTFRRQLYMKIRGNVEGFKDSLSGVTVRVTEDLAAGAESRLQYRGTDWTARNVGSTSIPGGSRARVVKAEGLTLHIEAE
jgi:membrane protein implicated in regulation of membrane protease activity